MTARKKPPVVEHPAATLGDRTIIRSQRDRDNPYFFMRRDAAQDDRLSWEGRGLLAYVLSKADNWKIRLGDLRKQGGAGRDVTRRILRELETAGYLTRERVRLAHGRFDWICTVYVKPQTAKNANNAPCPEKPSVAERSVAEPPAVERATADQPIYKVESQQTREVQSEDERGGESHSHKEAASPRASGSPSLRQRVKNVSRYSKKQLRRYVDSTGDARNAGALTQSLWVSGDADEDVAEYFATVEDGWDELLPTEGVVLLCDFLHNNDPDLNGWAQFIRANVVSEFDIWRDAMHETHIPGTPFDVREAVELYCEMVLSARQSAIEDAA